ncbi:MAG: hypothetical protein ACTS4V_01865 [Candidatus Hodgkinia cicadicola]
MRTSNHPWDTKCPTQTPLRRKKSHESSLDEVSYSWCMKSQSEGNLITGPAGGSFAKNARAAGGRSSEQLSIVVLTAEGTLKSRNGGAFDRSCAWFGCHPAG